MLNTFLLFAAFGLLIAAVTPAAHAQPAEDVPVRRVVLFSSGVGYFEHAGSVQGNAQTELRFKTEQINDVLKSLVLQDLGGGQIGAVVYPSQEPLARTLRSFQVDLAGNPTMAGVLDQLRGARVTVAAGGGTYTGTILGTETRSVSLGEMQVEQRTSLNLITGGLLRSVALRDVQSITLEDDELQRELDAALDALAQARDQDKKPVRISFDGRGSRPVRIGYVVETPVWKTSYRLLLPDEGGDAGRLQGWAIVENQTDNDWAGIDLSLVSGRPISFRQDLYTPLYVERPLVQAKTYANVRPQEYEAGFSADEMADGRAMSKARRSAPAMAAPQMEALSAEMDFAESSGVASQATSERVGELFQYTVDNVSLPRQRSAMLPIVTDAVAIERLSIFDPEVQGRHPLNGVELTNTSGSHLLAGPVTLFDDNTYAGDAQIDDLPPGQSRLLSYAVDLDVNVQVEGRNVPTDIRSARIVDGVLVAEAKVIYQRTYRIENEAERAKTVLLVHRRTGGATLADSLKPAEQTETHYRFRVDVPAGETAAFPVREEQTRGQRITLLSADIGTLTSYQTTGTIPADVRKRLGEVIERRRAVETIRRQEREVEGEINRIRADQERIRENLKSVESGSAYANRLLDKLNDQETELETLQSRLAELAQQRETAEAELRRFISSL